MTPPRTAIEICLEDLAGVAIVDASGAQRIELCADLAHGGTTPSIGTVRQAVDTVTDIDIQVLIRQRPGSFHFTAAELDAMLADIAAIRELPAPDGVTVGFVIGALTADHRIDTAALTALRETAGDRPVTFHRAFDAVGDAERALEQLIDGGIERVLTAGGPGTAAEGSAGLARLVEQSAGRIGILAAGGIRPGHAAALIEVTGVPEIHLRAPDPAFTDRQVTSAALVGAVVAEVAAQHGAAS